MKVLSLKEPYATLILNGVKKIETRSWKTNYRGKLYIHASVSKLSNEIRSMEELMGLVDINNLNYGKIICSCNLVDCIPMTEELINDIFTKDKKEYICGEYAVGRYAWILDNVEVLNPKIDAKGKLGIWNYDGE